MSIVLDREQHKVLTEAYHEAANFGATPRERKALTQALIVESNIRNLNHGDRDSLGPLQQRPSAGWQHPNNVKLAVRDFLTHARALRGQQGSAGTLAQGVQRSAYPGRYDAVASEANQLLSRYGNGASSTSQFRRHNLSDPTSYSIPGQVSTKTQVVDDPEAQRRVALAQMLQRTNPHSALLRLGVVDPSEPVTKTITRSQVSDSKTGSFGGRLTGNELPTDSSTNGVIGRLVDRASVINSKHLSYKWGGGHGGKVDPSTTGPLDCSGAVSAVLGVNPRVASQFMKWGQPGTGKRVTIYAKGDHTLMEIDGHFFGTSGTNPGGGAGWIPRKALSKEYLAQFVKRHPVGM